MTQWDESKPIYQQLRDLVVERILMQGLAAGESLPSVRQVAADEKINPLTVSRAYQLLVDEGLVEKRRGLGMFVTQDAYETALTRERQHFVEETWPSIMTRIEVLGLDITQLPQPGKTS